MVCKNCKREIDDDSIFCKWCGEKQIRERRKKAEVRVPKPRQLADGRWFSQVMYEYIRDKKPVDVGGLIDHFFVPG